MAKVLGLDIPDEFLQLFQNVLQLKPNGEVQGIGKTLQKTTYKKNVGLRDRSLFVSLQGYWEEFDSTRRDAWQNYWETLPFGSHSGSRGWPGSGYSAFVYVNAPRVANDEDLLLDPPAAAVTWHEQFLPDNGATYDIAFGAGVFVAVGYSEGYPMFISEDGYGWDFIPEFYGAGAIGIAFGNGIFVATVYDGSMKVATSSDGISWDIADPMAGQSLGTVAFGAGVFVIHGGDDNKHVYTSSDGISWSDQALTFSPYYGGQVDFVHDRFFVPGASNGYLYQSFDGYTWENIGFEDGCDFGQIAYGAGKWVAQFTDSPIQVVVSDDAFATYDVLPELEVTTGSALAFGSGYFVGAGHFGHEYMLSANGEDWERIDAFGEADPARCRYLDGKFFVCDSGGVGRIFVGTI